MARLPEPPCGAPATGWLEVPAPEPPAPESWFGSTGSSACAALQPVPSHRAEARSPRRAASFMTHLQLADHDLAISARIIALFAVRLCVDASLEIAAAGGTFDVHLGLVQVVEVDAHPTAAGLELDGEGSAKLVVGVQAPELVAATFHEQVLALETDHHQVIGRVVDLR